MTAIKRMWHDVDGRCQRKKKTRNKRQDPFSSWASVRLKIDIHFAKVSNNFEPKFIHSHTKYRHMYLKKRIECREGRSFGLSVYILSHHLYWSYVGWFRYEEGEIEFYVYNIQCAPLIIVTVDCCYRNVHLSFSCIISFISKYFLFNVRKYAVSYLNWFSFNDPHFSLTMYCVWICKTLLDRKKCANRADVQV